MPISADIFIRDYQKALDSQSAALFIGAGLSMPAGFVDWRNLLREIASDIGLNVDRETDLIALAQFHVNERSGRHKINQLIVDEYTKDAMLTRNHQIIAQLPISTVWTTNYDTLIEDAYKAEFKRVDVKTRTPDLAITLPKRDVTLFKMHGDRAAADEAVLTKEDYETYDQKRELFSMQLKGDLINKTFLFLGFSFTDPNIDYILGRIRALMGQNKRDHYCILKALDPKSKGKGKADYEYNKRKLELRIQDLARYGIHAILVPDYAEITKLLERLLRKVHHRNIFVSGSAHDFEPLGRNRLEGLAQEIGNRTIANGYNLISGLGLGIGGHVILGAMERLYAEQRSHLDERLKLRPFPQAKPANMSRDELWHRYREDMIAQAGASVFIAGNKKDGKNTVLAEGVRKEFEITVKLGRYPIPIGATGHVAAQLYEEVMNRLGKYFKGFDVKREFSVLGNKDATNAELTDALLAILNKLTRAKP